jgi:hypothetical protein
MTPKGTKSSAGIASFWIELRRLRDAGFWRRREVPLSGCSAVRTASYLNSTEARKAVTDFLQALFKLSIALIRFCLSSRIGHNAASAAANTRRSGT